MTHSPFKFFTVKKIVHGRKKLDKSLTGWLIVWVTPKEHFQNCKLMTNFYWADRTCTRKKPHCKPINVLLIVVVITEIFQVMGALQFIFVFLLILHTGRFPAVTPNLLETSILPRCGRLLDLKLLQPLLLFAESAEPDDEPVDQLHQGYEAEAEAGPYQSPSLSQEANPGERHNSSRLQQL